MSWEAASNFMWAPVPQWIYLESSVHFTADNCFYFYCDVKTGAGVAYGGHRFLI